MSIKENSQNAEYDGNNLTRNHEMLWKYRGVLAICAAAARPDGLALGRDCESDTERNPRH